jgi:hypothetical protein
MRKPKASRSNGKATADEQHVDAEWADVDLAACVPVRLDLDPALRERMRSRDRLRQLTLRVADDQIAEAKRLARTTKRKYQAVMRQWLADGASKARREWLKRSG